MADLAPDVETRPFWDGIAAGELRLQRCGDCGRAVFYPRALCPHCFGDRLEWFTSSGTGTVYSYTVARRAFSPSAGEPPYTVALIDLDEGVRMMSRIVGGDRVRIGDRVEMEITRLGGDDSPELPCFRVVEAI
ncbi:Zn-ribbon domain-containing OB-fold protein [Streptomyces sp. NRRL S-1824]|uniref:Zn-ribbon domain-containing OB-fold protein n=1 Tax=Streptomyces sp. NRRL S-1824 TaxID=1463889 RepID=UPI000AF7BB63|nr:Zn-ribbon domain-containing OB-fold protein [Streptomyces sp. NRRL S-1824]